MPALVSDDCNQLTDVAFHAADGTLTRQVHYIYDENSLRISKAVDDIHGDVYQPV